MLCISKVPFSYFSCTRKQAGNSCIKIQKIVRMSSHISILSKVTYCLQPSPTDRQLKELQFGKRFRSLIYCMYTNINGTCTLAATWQTFRWSRRWTFSIYHQTAGLRILSWQAFSSFRCAWVQVGVCLHLCLFSREGHKSIYKDTWVLSNKKLDVRSLRPKVLK